MKADLNEKKIIIIIIRKATNTAEQNRDKNMIHQQQQ